MTKDLVIPLSLDDASFRTLVGTNLLFDGFGAIGEIFINPRDSSSFLTSYEENINFYLKKFHFDPPCLYKKIYSMGAIFALKTEFDLSYVGREILECAFKQTIAETYASCEFNLTDELAKLRDLCLQELDFKLRILFSRARERGLNAFYADGIVTVGSGVGLWSSPIRPIDLEAIPWETIHNIPTVAVTGSNGKTTTVILTKFIAEQSGLTVGYSSTESVVVGDKTMETGDLSGPYGAQMVLCDKNAHIAILELARGSIVKRGILVTNLNAAVVTNISSDHLGLNGIDDVSELAGAKFLIQRKVGKNGYHVINLDDELSCGFIKDLPGRKMFFSQKMSATEISAFFEHENDLACFIEDSILTIITNDKVQIVDINTIPLTYNGLATHNIENVLAATCLSMALGCSYANIKKGLLNFNANQLNKGRLNVFSMNGYKNTLMLVDYAHNVAAVDNVIKFAKTAVGMGAKITLLVGLTGDRIFMIDDMARMIIAHDLDFILLKAFGSKLRGAKVGEVANLMWQSLIKQGLATDKLLGTVEFEVEAVDRFLAELEDNHAYIVLSQEEIEQVVDKIEKFNS